MVCGFLSYQDGHSSILIEGILSYSAPPANPPIQSSKRARLIQRLKCDRRLKLNSRMSKSRSAKSSLVLLLSGIMLSLAGCNNSSLSEAAAKFTDHDDDQHCVRVSQPFKHSLCSVSQEQLSKPQPSVHLKLFWRPADVSSKSASEPKSQTNPAVKSNSQPAPSEQKPLYTFKALLSDLPDTSKLAFAANAGMYNKDFAPIGYTVIEGQEILSLNLKEGAGNFHLLPNGVLWWNKSGEVFITESHEMQQMLDKGKAEPWYATQSGPMLVIKGAIHPQFDPNSTSLKFRNGVGVCTDGKVKFVNSDQPVSFYQFAALFKDDLSCPNALFLDGGIASALYAPDISQEDDKNMGVMVGVVKDQ